MALPVAQALATVGVVLLASTAASAIFRVSRIPDVLQLLLFGVLAGPILGLLDADLFAQLAPLASTGAVLLILFDGGLDIRLRDLRQGAGPSLLLAVLAWTSTTILAAGVAVLVLDMSVPLAILLGMCFGGAGVAIVIPMIRSMGVSRQATAIVSLETAASDVLLVVGVFSMASALAIPGSGPPALGQALAQQFLVGIGLGAAAGWAWSRALARPFVAGHESVVTIGAIFLIYALTEALHGSGPLAVLAFALAIANSHHGRALSQAEHPEGLPAASPRAAASMPSSFHRHAMLAVRAFVFVGLGVTVDVALLRGPVVLAAALITAAVIVARGWATGFIRRGRVPGRYDRAAVAIMFPCGLPTAAGALIPWTRFELEGTQVFPQVAALVILFTTLANGIAVAVLLHPWVKQRLGNDAPAP